MPAKHTLQQLIFCILIFWSGMTACRPSPVPEAATATSTVQTPEIESTPPPTETPKPPPTPDLAGVAHAIAALTIIPANFDLVHIVDWSKLKEHEGVQDLTSRSDRENWLTFFQTVAQQQAILPLYIQPRLPKEHVKEHVTIWSWDTADLEWEAMMMVNRPISYILKFRPDFDFTPVITHFEARNFTKTVYHGMTIYSHKLDPQSDWAPYSPLSSHNTAVLPEAGLLIASLSIDNIHQIIDTYSGRADSLITRASVQATMSSLGEVYSVFLSADACATFSAESLLENPFQKGFREHLESQLTERPQLQDYETLGIGYRYEQEQSVGRIVMQFANPDLARADLAARQQLATEGLGFVREAAPRPYHELYFSLFDASVESSQIILAVEPAQQQPGRLFAMAYQVDMVFATCP